MKLWHNIGRGVFAVIFFLGANVNIVILFRNPEIFSGFADLSILPVYHSLWASIVMPHLQLFIVLIILFELSISIMLIARAPYVTIGLYLGAAFMLFLFPFWWSGAAIINLIFMISMLILASGKYPESIPGTYFKRFN